MQIMHRLGCEPILVHPSNIETMINYGWSVEKPVVEKIKPKKQTKTSNEKGE